MAYNYYGYNQGDIIELRSDLAHTFGDCVVITWEEFFNTWGNNYFISRGETLPTNSIPIQVCNRDLGFTSPIHTDLGHIVRVKVKSKLLLNDIFDEPEEPENDNPFGLIQL